LIEDKLKNYLKNNDFEKARGIYTTEYHMTRGAKLFMKILFLINQL